MKRSRKGCSQGLRRGTPPGRWLAVASIAAVGAVAGAGSVAAQEELSGPLTAQSAMQLALEQNVDVLSSEQDWKAAGGRFKSARSPLLPSLGLDFGYRNPIEQPPIFVTGEGLVRAGSPILWSGSAGINMQLVNFGTWNRTKSAARAEDAFEFGYGATRADVALEAYRRFYELLKAQKLAEVSTENLALTRDQLRRTEALYELGSVAKGDVLKQQVQVSQSELDLIRDRRAILVQRARLAQYLGLDPNQPLPIDTTLTVPRLEADSVAVLEEALSRRPEILQSQAQVASAEAGLAAAQGLRYPSVDGNLSMDVVRASGDRFAVDDLNDQKEVTLGLRLSLPVFDGLNAKGQIQDARARKEQAVYANQNLRLLVEVEVEEALQAVSLSRERIAVAQAALDAADEDLKLSQERYNVGAATVLDLITAQVAWARARSDYVSAVADAHVAVMQVRRVRGEAF